VPGQGPTVSGTVTYRAGTLYAQRVSHIVPSKNLFYHSSEIRGRRFPCRLGLLRYRVALGDFGPDLLTAEELVGETLTRAWRDRRRRLPLLKFRVWLLAVLFRVAEDIARREAQFRKLATESLEAPVPPEPIYDDESFWEWYQPDELTRWEDVVADPSSLSPEDAVAVDEQLTHSLAPRARQVFVLRTIHRVSLREVAQALGISVSEATHLLAEARRLVGVVGGGEGS
jgi:RNA polymerase sigma factor (sigma-70 family)